MENGKSIMKSSGSCSLLFCSENRTAALNLKTPSMLHGAVMRIADNKPQNHDMRPTWMEQSGGTFPHGFVKCTRKPAPSPLYLEISPGGAWGIEFLLKSCTSTIMFSRIALSGKVQPAGSWEKVRGQGWILHGSARLKQVSDWFLPAPAVQNSIQLRMDHMPSSQPMVKMVLSPRRRVPGFDLSYHLVFPLKPLSSDPSVRGFSADLWVLRGISTTRGELGTLSISTQMDLISRNGGKRKLC